jgi:hypothetical protein
MIKPRIERIKTVEDFLTPEEIECYHRQWKHESKQLSTPLKTMYINKTRPDHIVITDFWQYKDYPIYRAGVLQDRFSWISMDPPQPFWHEYHYWQVFEQISCGVRKSLVETGRAKTPIVYIDLKEPTWFGHKTSVELIPEIKRRQTEDGPMTIEDHYCTFYDAKNKPHCRMFVKIVATKRFYELDYDRLLKGDEKALDDLLKRMEIQEKRLKKVGRTSKVNREQITNMLKSGNYGQELLDSLYEYFSLWDRS